MDQNVKSLANLQEAFRGCIDPEVVDLIFTESNYVVDDALEKLLSISQSDSSSDNWGSVSENKSTNLNGAASTGDCSQGNNSRPTVSNTSTGPKKTRKAASFRDDKSNSQAILPKSQDYSDVDVTEREIRLDSTKQLYNSTKEVVEAKDSPLHDPNLHSTNRGTEVTDQPLSSNQLPPWPDHNQSYLHRLQSFSHQPQHGYQGLPIQHNFQGQRFPGNGSYFHDIPQPRSALHIPPGIRYYHQPMGLHPGHSTPPNRAKIYRKEIQPHFGMTKPQREERRTFSTNQIRSEEIFLPPGKVLVMLRGLPGSGKTTLAKKMKCNGLILSTDDFFTRNGKYQFEPNDLAEAHEWNQKRAKESMQRGVSPVIIDNTNMQAWEMRPYVSMGQRFGYKTIIKEPDTPWKWNTKELLKRNQHEVTRFSIQNMKEKYERNLTVETILATSWEKQENVNPKIELCDKNEDEVCRKEKSHNKQTSQELSSVSEKDKDVPSLGLAEQSQFANKTNKQLENSVALHKLFSSSQPSNQSSKRSKLKSEDAQPEMETLRSHGCRSPIQDIDFSLSELSQPSQSLEINKSFNTEGNFDETPLPKPQRSPKKRERSFKPLEKMETTESKEVKKKPNKILDSKEAKSNLCENEQKSHAFSESTSSVDFISKEKENSDDNDNNLQKLITRIDNDENTLCKTVSCHLPKCATTNEITHHSTNETHSKDGEPKQDLISLQNEDAASCDATGKESAISLKKEMENTGSSLLRNPFIADESMAVTTNREEFCLESCLAKEIKKGQSENDKDEMNVKEKDFLLDKTNDMNEPFKNTKITPGFFNSSEKTKTEKESSLEDFKNDLSESELSGFQFLTTCFPDINVQFLVDVLADNQGDITKAVESILCYEDSSLEVKSEKQNTSDLESLGKIAIQTSSNQRKSSAYTTPDKKTLQSGDFQESLAAKPIPSLQSTNDVHHVGHDYGCFQMTLEPAVAIHLMELFGPIDSVSLEGDFSSKDLIVKVDSDFAKLLYNQWRATIQENIKEKLFYTDDQPKVSRTENKEDSDKGLKGTHRQQSLEHGKATDLRLIMYEQMAVEQSRQEQEQSSESMAVVLKRQKLYTMFPGVDPLALDELFEANRYKLQPTVSMVETSCSLSAKTSGFQEKQSRSNSRSYDVDSLGELKTEFQALQDPDYEDFRAEANTHYKLRDECFRKAAFAFSKKQGQLAQHYASQGHMHTEKIRQANRRAAARILEHKNSNVDQNTLDLHGLHVDEALLALEEKLLLSDLSTDRPRYLSVITGRGIHSKQGKAKIKPAVLEYLQRNNYRFEELQPGLVRVSLNR